MEASAVHLMWVAAATYCTLLAPHNLLASIIGILGMAHFSLGEYTDYFLFLRELCICAFKINVEKVLV